MTHYLISFPSAAMRHVRDEELPSVSEAAHAVVRAAKAAGVYVFGGGIDERIAPVLITADGEQVKESAAEPRRLDGGFCVLRVATRAEAEAWAARLAAACRCPQELRAFMFDPES
ncbi:MAG: hypothetical protein MUF21_13095 [Gemmatimonadaceae bacterium]|jgi:hypothetical protein|nr:hypothetical protein [Gemmatimonadaceae bacterium]